MDGILNYSQYGNRLYRTDLNWSDDSGLNDIILFDCTARTAELTNGLKFNTTLDSTTRDAIVNIIKE